jgi:hypothetical protein
MTPGSSQIAVTSLLFYPVSGNMSRKRTTLDKKRQNSLSTIHKSSAIPHCPHVDKPTAQPIKIHRLITISSVVDSIYPQPFEIRDNHPGEAGKRIATGLFFML